MIFFCVKIVNKSEKKQEIGMMTKVTSCHDIWASGQYTDKFWRPEIYKTIYRKDYGNKYFFKKTTTP